MKPLPKLFPFGVSESAILENVKVPGFDLYLIDFLYEYPASFAKNPDVVKVC